MPLHVHSKLNVPTGTDIISKVPFTPLGKRDFCLVPVTGLEPVRSISPRDFKSLVSAYSTTPAFSKTTPHFITVLS